MVKIEDLQLAVALGKSPSLSAAARDLNVTTSALSMRLRKLEQRLGRALAVRSARQLSLTPEGQRFADEAKTLLAQLEALPESFRHDAGRLTGTLRVAAPFGYGRHRIAPALGIFTQRHPDLRIQLDLRESPWTNRHDADVVVHIGAVRDSSWVARTIAKNERWLCASPAYIERDGAPEVPRDLLRHRCICIRENEEDMTLWSYRRLAASGVERAPRESIRVEPRLLTNDGSVARHWAEQGLGIVLRSEWDLVDAVARGSLRRLLPDWHFENAPVMLLVPTRKGRSARVEALCSFLESELASA